MQFPFFGWVVTKSIHRKLIQVQCLYFTKRNPKRTERCKRACQLTSMAAVMEADVICRSSVQSLLKVACVRKTDRDA
jgi:hypothetical protein